MLRVEFIKQYLTFPPGAVAELASGVVDVLVKRGIARVLPVVPEPTPKKKAK